MQNSKWQPYVVSTQQKKTRHSSPKTFFVWHFIENAGEQSAASFFFFVNWNMYKGLWVFQGWKDLKYAFKLCQVKEVKQRLPSKDPSNWDGLRRCMLTWLPRYAALLRMKPSDWEIACEVSGIAWRPQRRTVLRHTFVEIYKTLLQWAQWPP